MSSVDIFGIPNGQRTSPKHRHRGLRFGRSGGVKIHCIFKKYQTSVNCIVLQVKFSIIVEKNSFLNNTNNSFFIIAPSRWSFPQYNPLFLNSNFISEVRFFGFFKTLVVVLNKFIHTIGISIHLYYDHNPNNVHNIRKTSKLNLSLRHFNLILFFIIGGNASIPQRNVHSPPYASY